jgi:hypothetical protein
MSDSRFANAVIRSIVTGCRKRSRQVAQGARRGEHSASTSPSVRRDAAAVGLAGIVGVALGALFIVALLVVLVVQNVVLLSFGWLNAIDAVFCDVAVGIAPYGCDRLVSLDWSYTTRQSNFSLSHSGSYTDAVAINTNSQID